MSLAVITPNRRDYSRKIMLLAKPVLPDGVVGIIVTELLLICTNSLKAKHDCNNI
jgi:hypothetical protein